MSSRQFRVLVAFDPLSVQGNDPGRVIGVAFWKQGYCRVTVTDGDGFISFDGGVVVDNRAIR